MENVIKSLSDPRLTWYSYRAFGGFIRHGTVTTSNPQLLYVCDEYICIPARFSEYFHWSDGNGNLVRRIFPNNAEAWDHDRETNPTMSAPYDGRGVLLHGFSGYGGYIDLICGTSKCTVTLVVRRYPEPQILIYNLSSSTIRVNDPPVVHGFNRYTTGTAGSGFVDLEQNQYVLYYRSNIASVHSSGFFSQSPLGIDKRWINEIYLPSSSTLFGRTFPTTVYLGFKTHRDIPWQYNLISFIYVSYDQRGGINTSAMVATGIGGFNIYKDDPYAFQGTWAGGNLQVLVYNGWAEDDNGNVKYIYESGIDISVNTKREEKYRRYTVKLYAVDNDEWIVSSFVRPTVNTYSYSRAAQTIAPDFMLPIPPSSTITRSMYMSPTDSITEVTSPVNRCWAFYDGWVLANFLTAPISGAVAKAALFIYTDDTGVSLPSDARQAFGVGYCNSIAVLGLQVVRFGDRWLQANRVYATAARYKIFTGSVTSADISNWARRIYPKVLTSSEWNALLSTIPFRVVLMGANIFGNVSMMVPATANPDMQITVSGNVNRQANVRVIMYDPDTYDVVASASTTSNINGDFSVNLTIPSGTQPKIYKIMAIAES